MNNNETETAEDIGRAATYWREEAMRLRAQLNAAQCAICFGEHDYEVEISCHQMDGSVASEDRRICRDCLAQFLVCLSSDIRAH